MTRHAQTRAAFLRRVFAACLASAALPLLGGCAYRLGTGARPAFSSLAILPIENETLAPQMQALLSQQLADQLSQEGGVRVVSGEGAAATLRVRIVRYTHDVAATDPRDTVLGRSFNLRLRARCSLKDNRTGSFLFEDREIVASAVAHADGGFSDVEYQTMPVLTRELARKIRDGVTGTW